MNKVNVALIGYGHLGKWHAQKADGLEASNLVAIVEPFEKNQLLAKENHPNAKVVASVEEIIDEIDAAIIVTPTSFHFDVTKYLLEKKKHIFCEKPLCSSSDEAVKLSELKDSSLKFQVGHSERCHEAWDKIKPYTDKIEGKVHVKINRFAPFKGRATDVDVVQDLMIHDLDLCHYIFNKKFKSLVADGYKIRTDKWDHVTCYLFAQDGSIFEITSGRNHTYEQRTLEIMSSNGCIFVDMFKNEYSIADNSSTNPQEFVQNYTYEKRDHLNIEQERFYNSILNDSKEMVTFEEGSNIVSVIDKVLESLDKNEEIKL
ncbi:MAG: Gfo/Idh/MocA family oxidoreductase [Bacteriovoracaceae bacterium]|jgi:predicted dehydrogenase|nr:Gfo/Idh/MocA family oxidoreductase [Bacteriovoracaceae bacterium]